MKHNHLDPGMLRASLDGQLDPAEASTVAKQLRDCAECAAELQVIEEQAASVRVALEHLPRLSEEDLTHKAHRTWAAIERRKEEAAGGWAGRTGWIGWAGRSGWAGWNAWPLAGCGLAAAALVVVLTVAPVRAWAESLLAVFRVEHFTVLELNANPGNGLQNNEMLNQTVSHILSDEVTVTQAPQKPLPVADAATATRLAGFPVKLLRGETPRSLMLESGAGAQMKLDRDRLQSILDEAGRNDLRIPASVDGATIAVRIPAGIMAQYGNCPNGMLERPPDATCISLMQLPSPVASIPSQVDPAKIAQVALEFFGMSANDAANFTQTVDWTSTLVLPVMRGKTTYEQVHVNGNEGVLLRSKGSQGTGHFTLMWVDAGIVLVLNGEGDDTTALNLGSQLL